MTSYSRVDAGERRGCGDPPGEGGALAGAGHSCAALRTGQGWQLSPHYASQYSPRTPSRCRWAPRHSGRASAADPPWNANQLGTRADGGRGQCGYPPHGRRPSAASLAALPLPSALARRQPGSSFPRYQGRNRHDYSRQGRKPDEDPHWLNALLARWRRTGRRLRSVSRSGRSACVTAGLGSVHERDDHRELDPPARRQGRVHVVGWHRDRHEFAAGF